MIARTPEPGSANRTIKWSSGPVIRVVSTGRRNTQVEPGLH